MPKTSTFEGAFDRLQADLNGGSIRFPKGEIPNLTWRTAEEEVTEALAEHFGVPAHMLNSPSTHHNQPA